MNPLIPLVGLASLYIMLVSICVAGRMTRATRHSIRWPIIAIAGIAAWTVLRVVTVGTDDFLSSSLSAITVSGALTLALFPRIRT